MKDRINKHRTQAGGQQIDGNLTSTLTLTLALTLMLTRTWTWTLICILFELSDLVNVQN